MTSTSPRTPGALKTPPPPPPNAHPPPQFGLSGAHHLTPIVKLSGGQKARVVFASIALSRPHILLLDEVRLLRCAVLCCALRCAVLCCAALCCAALR